MYDDLANQDVNVLNILSKKNIWICYWIDNFFHQSLSCSNWSNFFIVITPSFMHENTIWTVYYWLVGCDIDSCVKLYGDAGVITLSIDESTKNSLKPRYVYLVSLPSNWTLSCDDFIFFFLFRFLVSLVTDFMYPITILLVPFFFNNHPYWL